MYQIFLTGENTYKFYAYGGRRVNNSKEKNKSWKPGSWSICLCLLGFFFILGAGLLTAELGFNDFTGKRNKVSIFAFNEDGIGRYKIDLFGRKQELDIQGIWWMIQDTKRIIESVFSESK